MMSFITCEPTSSVPTQPKSTQAHGFTSRRNRKSETSCQLPGGRIVESRTASSAPLLPLRELLIRPSTTSKLEKKARNILKATACDTMPHCGMTLASVRNSFFARELSAIARNYIEFGAQPRCLLFAHVSDSLIFIAKRPGMFPVFRGTP